MILLEKVRPILLQACKHTFTYYLVTFTTQPVLLFVYKGKTETTINSIQVAQKNTNIKAILTE